PSDLRRCCLILTLFPYPRKESRKFSRLREPSRQKRGRRRTGKRAGAGPPPLAGMKSRTGRTAEPAWRRPCPVLRARPGEPDGRRPMGWYPMLVQLAGRPGVVIGGGRVAERKVAALLEAEARVRVVSPSLTPALRRWAEEDRKSTRLNSSHVKISYAVFCLKKK